MGYGITALNNSNGLTFSSDGRVYGYLGQATYVQTVQPEGPMTGTLGWPSLVEYPGYSDYTFNWPGPIVAAVPIKTNGSTAILGMSQTGSTWTIEVHKGTGATNAIGFDIQEPTQVYVFGLPTTVSGYGLAIYNSAGNLAGDLSRRPLTFDKFVSLPSGITTSSFSGLTVPAVVGMPHWFNVISEPYDQTFNDNRVYNGAWKWSSTSGLLIRTLYLSSFERSVNSYSYANDIPITSAIIMEASGLT